MAKLNRSNGIKKIDLEDITLLDNVRKDYDEIEERARSIERDGLLSPVIIDNDNNLIAGYCRYKAHELLVSEGKPYNQIECIIRTGDFNIIQLTENIQRSNLKPEELEAGLRKMIDSGMKPVEIAERLNKSKQWVSDVLAADKVRQKTDIDTSEISSSAMSLLRGLSESELEAVIFQVKKNGSTVKAVKEAIKDKKPVHPFDRIKKEAVRLNKAGYDYQEIIGEIGWAIL